MGSVVAPLIGQQQAAAQLDAANDARHQALGQWTGLNAPSVADQQLNFANYQNAGNYNPALEQAFQQSPNAMSGIQTDPRLVQSQMSALAQLSQTGQMGMTPGEKAALIQAQQNAASQAQAKNAQIIDQYARTGMGGSGAQLAAQLANSQAQAQQLGNNSNQVAQNAQQNALQAISQSGNLAGQIQGQQFGEKAQIAAAQNAINNFNAMNSQNVANINNQNTNSAQLRNLNNSQSLSNQNTQLANQQQQYNKQLLQQQFNNQAALAAGRSGQYQGIAQANQQNAANTANMYAGIGQGVDQGAGAIYNYSQKSGNNGQTAGGGGDNYLDGYFDAMPSGNSTGGATGNFSQDMAGGAQDDMSEAGEYGQYFA